MESDLESVWKNRLHNQKFELIGTTTPGDGNGYNDKISIDIPHEILINSNKDYNGWIYNIYFRNLTNLVNLRNSFDNGDSLIKSLKLNNATDYYKETFNKYIKGTSSRHRNDILKILEDWCQVLIYRGRLVLEFVSWFDNETNEFYGFQLKLLEDQFLQINRRNVTLSINKTLDSNIFKHKSVLPKNKCIIIEWPKELGGYKGYKNKVEALLKLGNKEMATDDALKGEYGIAINKMNKWQMDFDSIISDWGITPQNDSVTEFFKKYNTLTLKQTAIYCNLALIEGLRQVVNMLNKRLDENATLELNSELIDIKNHKRIMNGWISGEVSIDEIDKYLSF